MVSLIVIAVMIVLVWLFFKTKNVQHRIYTILIIAFLLFFYITGSKVIAQNNVDVKTFDGFIMAGKLYISWLGHVVVNAKTIVGDALNMDWAGNSTIK